MKIEWIELNWARNMIGHYNSSGCLFDGKIQKNIGKRTAIPDMLNYVEKYIEENDFEFFTQVSIAHGLDRIVLVKK